MKLRKLVALSLAIMFVLTLVPSVIPVNAVGEALVQNGLVANFDAGGLSAKQTTWTDTTGKYTVTVPNNENNYFTGTAYHLSGTRVKLPNEMLACVNARQFTVEMRMGKIYKIGSSYSTLLNNSSNDYFSLFLRTNDDNVEFKCGSNTRPHSASGRELVEDSTVTITFDLATKKNILYIDGRVVDSRECTTTINADGYFAFGHDEASRAHTADYEAIRFYNRALTPAEVIQNAKADGNYDESYVEEAAFINASDKNLGNILNTPATVMYIDSKAAFDAFKASAVKPSNIMVTTAGGSTKCGESLKQIFDACNTYSVIPNFYVTDNASADAVAEYINKQKINDVSICVPVNNTALFDRVKKAVRSINRIGVMYDSMSSFNAHDVRVAVNTLDANYVILPSNVATQENVRALRDLNVVTWVFDKQTMSGNLDLAYCVTSGASGIVTARYDELVNFVKILSPNTLTTTPIIIGHRGNPTNAPENSISSYVTAVKNGSDVVETDIQLTKDGQLVVMHDSTINRVTTYTGSASVSSMTMAEIKKYNLWGENNRFKATHPDERVPSFEEMLVALKDLDCKIFVEFKQYDAKCVAEFVRLVKKYNYADRICVISFGADALRNVHTQMPEMSTGFLLSAIPAYSNNDELAALLKQQITAMQSCGSSLNINYGNLNETFVDAIEARGFAIWPWTLSQGARAVSDNLFLWGIEGITTNDCQDYKNTVEYLKYDSRLNIAGPERTAKLALSSVTYGDTVSDISSAAKYTVLSGSDVVSVDGGTVTAKKTGSAVIMASYTCKTPSNKQYVLTTSPIVISVGDADISDEGQPLKLKSGSKYTMDSKYVEGVTVGTTASELAAKFDSDVKLFDRSGKEISGSAKVTTGTVVATMLGGAKFDSRILVVDGDVNCDGEIDENDCIDIKRMIITDAYFDEAAVKAADIVMGYDVDSLDYLVVKRIALGIISIDSLS